MIKLRWKIENEPEWRFSEAHYHHLPMAAILACPFFAGKLHENYLSRCLWMGSLCVIPDKWDFDLMERQERPAERDVKINKWKWRIELLWLMLTLELFLDQLPLLLVWLNRPFGLFFFREGLMRRASSSESESSESELLSSTANSFLFCWKPCNIRE